MGINDESDIEAGIQIGPTDNGMVRIFIVAGDMEIPMDSDPEEADESDDKIRDAAIADVSEPHLTLSSTSRL